VIARNLFPRSPRRARSASGAWWGVDPKEEAIMKWLFALAGVALLAAAMLHAIL
jgi:hypothetical protein